jgi:hypothetical protein
MMKTSQTISELEREKNKLEIASKQLTQSNEQQSSTNLNL